MNETSGTNEVQDLREKTTENIIRPVVFYGVCGEGLGHASRAQNIVEKLSHKFDFHIFTFGQGYDYLSKILNEKNLHKIDGIRWAYNKKGVSKWGTLKNVVNYLHNIRNPLSNSGFQNNLKLIEKLDKEKRVHSFLTDFEPSIGWYARNHERSLVGLASQYCDYKELLKLPLKYILYKKLVGWFANLYTGFPKTKIIDTFYSNYIESNDNNITLITSSPRDEFKKYKNEDNGYLLIYSRPSIELKLLQSIYPNIKCKVYGTKFNLQNGNWEYKIPSYSEFVKDLCGCSAVISTAGISLITECKLLVKSVLAIPEPGQIEQEINGFYINEMKIGKSVSLNNLTSQVIEDFLNENTNLIHQ